MSNNTITVRNIQLSYAEAIERINTLRKQLSGDLFQDMELREQIHEIEMKLNGVKPESAYYVCENCGG